jgi:hypothetical protein
MDCSTARPRMIFAKLGGRVLDLGSPTAWSQLLSVGTITKGLGFEDLWLNMLILAVFSLQLAGGGKAAEERGLLTHVVNIFYLTIKELRSIRAEPMMRILVFYAFTIAVYTVATGASTETKDLTVGVVDEDRSDVSHRLMDALNPPLFKRTVLITANEIDANMNDGDLMFVLEIPASIQSRLLAGRQTSLQLNIDATAIAQAGNGAVYIQTIIAQELAKFQAGREGAVSTPVNLAIRAKFNPNLYAIGFPPSCRSSTTSPCWR